MKRNLMTSGMRWGVSCEVDNEAQLGVILGYMKLFGASAIGFESLGKRDEDKDPSAVARGRLGGTARRRRPHESGQLLVEARKVIATLQPEWHKSHFAKRLGWSNSATSRALALLISAKEIGRLKGIGKRGWYRTLPKIVRAAS